MFLEIPVQLQEASVETMRLTLEELASNPLDVGVGFKAVTDGEHTTVGVKMPGLDRLHSQGTQNLASLQSIAKSGADTIKATGSVVKAVEKSIRVMSKTSPTQALTNILTTPLRMLSTAADQFASGATAEFSKAAQTAFTPITKGLARMLATNTQKGLTRSARSVVRRAGFDSFKEVGYVADKISKGISDPVKDFSNSVRFFAKFAKDARSGGIGRALENQQKDFTNSLKQQGLAAAKRRKKGDPEAKMELAYLEMVQNFMNAGEILRSPVATGGSKLRKILARNNDLLTPIRGQRVAGQSNDIMGRFDRQELKKFTPETLAGWQQGKKIVKPLYASEDKGNDSGRAMMKKSLESNLFGDSAVYDFQDEVESGLRDLISKIPESIRGKNIDSTTRGVATSINSLYGSESAQGVAEEILHAIASGIPGADITLAGYSSGGARASQTLNILEVLSQNFSDRAKKAESPEDKSRYKMIAKELLAVKGIGAGGATYEPNQRNMISFVHDLDKFVGGLRQPGENTIKRTKADLQIDHGSATYIADPEVISELAKFLEITPPTANRYQARVFQEENDKVANASPGKKRAVAMRASENFLDRAMDQPEKLKGFGEQVQAVISAGMDSIDVASAPQFEMVFERVVGQINNLLDESPELKDTEEFAPYIQTLNRTIEQFRDYLKGAQAINQKGLPPQVKGLALEKYKDQKLRGKYGQNGLREQYDIFKSHQEYLANDLDAVLRSAQPVEYPEPVKSVRSQVDKGGLFGFLRNITETYEEVKSNPTEAIAKVANQVQEYLETPVVDPNAQLGSVVVKAGNTFYNTIQEAANLLGGRAQKAFDAVDQKRQKLEGKFGKYLPASAQAQLSLPPAQRAQYDPAALDFATPLVDGMARIGGAAQTQFKQIAKATDLAPKLQSFAIHAGAATQTTLNAGKAMYRFAEGAENVAFSLLPLGATLKKPIKGLIQASAAASAMHALPGVGGVMDVGTSLIGTAGASLAGKAASGIGGATGVTQAIGSLTHTPIIGQAINAGITGVSQAIQHGVEVGVAGAANLYLGSKAIQGVKSVGQVASTQVALPPGRNFSSIHDPQLVASSKVKERNLDTLTVAQLKKALARSRGANVGDKVTQGMTPEAMRSELSIFSPKQLGMLLSDTFRQNQGEKVSRSQKSERQEAQKLIDAGDLEGAATKINQALQNLRGSRTNISPQVYRGLEGQLKGMLPKALPTVDIKDAAGDIVNYSLGVGDLFDNLKKATAPLAQEFENIDSIAQYVFNNLGGKGDYKSAFKIVDNSPGSDEAAGAFSPETGKLWVKDLGAMLQGSKSTFATFAHEVTHAIQTQRGDKYTPMQLTQNEMLHLPEWVEKSTSLDPSNMREIVKEMEAYAVELRTMFGGSRWAEGLDPANSKSTPEILRAYKTAQQKGLGAIRQDSQNPESNPLERNVDLSGGESKVKGVFDTLPDEWKGTIKTFTNLGKTLFPNLADDLEGAFSAGNFGGVINGLSKTFANLGLGAAKAVGSFALLKSILSSSAGAIEATQRFAQLDRQIKAASKGSETLASVRAEAEANNVSASMLAQLRPATILATQGTENASLSKELSINLGKLSKAYGLNREEASRLSQAGQQVIGKNRLQAEEARGQIGELIPGFMSSVAQAKGVGIDQLDSQFKSGSVNLVDFNRALKIATSQAGGGVITLGTESNKLAEKLEAMSAESGQIASAFAMVGAQSANAILEHTAPLGTIFNNVIPAAIALTTISLAVLAKSALTAALSLARHVVGVGAVNSALKAMVGSAVNTAKALALATAAVYIFSGLIESMQFGSDLREIGGRASKRDEEKRKKEKEERDKAGKKPELAQAVGAGGVIDILTKPFEIMQDKLLGIKDDRDFIEKARSGRLKDNWLVGDGNNNRRNQALQIINDARDTNNNVLTPFRQTMADTKAKVTPINEQLEIARAELEAAKVKAGMDPSTKNLEARNAAASKVSNLSADQTVAMQPIYDVKKDIDDALAAEKKHLERQPMLESELAPKIRELEKASKDAEESIKDLTSGITSNTEAQQKAYYKAQQKIARTNSAEERAQVGFDAQRSVAATSSGQLGSFDTAQANSQIDLKSLQSGVAAAQSNLDAAGEGIKGTSKNLRIRVEAALGKKIEDSSASEIDTAVAKLKSLDDSFDASELTQFAQVRDDSLNKIAQSNGEIVRKQAELENSIFERNQAIADYLREANRKVEDQAIEFASAQADLAESATNLSLNAKISKMKSDMSVAAARAQAKFAGIADDFTGGVVNGILGWFDTMNQTLTSTLEKKLAMSQADAERRALQTKIDSFNLKEQRAEEDSALEGQRFAGQQTKFKGVQITSAIDASGEPGLDYVVDNGRKGAPVGSVTEGKVIEIKRNQKEIHKEKGQQGRSAGNVVIVRSVDPKTGKEADLLYAHFDKIAVALGDLVKVGDVLGTQGRTGSTTGAHVSLDFYGKDANTVSEASDNLRRQTLAGLQSGGLNAKIEPRAQTETYKSSGTKSSGTPSADQFVGAVLAILEAGNRQDRIDVAQVISNRVGSNFDGYGTTIRDQAFASNQFQPFFSKNKGGYGIQKDEIQDFDSAVKALGKAKFSPNEATAALNEFFGDIGQSFRTKAAESFVKGRAFFKGTSEQGSMQAGDKIRSKDANFFHYQGTNQAGSKVTPIQSVFGKAQGVAQGVPGAPAYSAKTLTDQGNEAAIAADLDAKIQAINDQSTIAKYTADKQLKEVQLSIKKQEKQSLLDAAQAVATQKINTLKASTPQTDEIGQQRINLEEKKTQNELERGKIDVELVDATGGLEILRDLLAYSKEQKNTTPENLATIESAIKAQQTRISNLKANQAVIGGDRNEFDEQYRMEQLLSEQAMRSASINNEIEQGVQNPYLSQTQQMSQKESSIRFDLAQKMEANRLEMMVTKQIALSRASAISGNAVTDLAEALRILGGAAAGGDKDAKGLSDKLTALQRAALVLPEQAQLNIDIQRKQAASADRATVKEGQSRVLSQMSSAMNNPYRDQAYYSPMQEQILIAQNQMQLAESLQWVDDNAGALGAIGVTNLKDQLTELSQISLKNSIAELDSVRLGLKNTFQNSFQSFFADIKNGELGIGEVFSNLAENILGGIVDQFATIASDRMSSMLAQAIPGGNLTNKAGLGLHGKESQMAQLPTGFQAQGQESMVSNPLLGVASGLLGGGEVVPGSVPVSVVSSNEKLAPGGAEGLARLLNGGEGKTASALSGGAAGTGGVGAAAGSPWGMVAMLGLSLGAGLLSKSKNKKNQEPPDAMKDWKVAADWKPTPGAINWGDQYKQEIQGFSAALLGLNLATRETTQTELRQNELKANQRERAEQMLFNQNVNVQASNLRSFKQSERQVAASSQSMGQKQYARLG